MFPNRNMQRAEQRYVSAISGMEAAERGVMQNMLFAEAKTAFFNWLVLDKKTRYWKRVKPPCVY